MWLEYIKYSYDNDNLGKLNTDLDLSLSKYILDGEFPEVPEEIKILLIFFSEILFNLNSLNSLTGKKGISSSFFIFL